MGSEKDPQIQQQQNGKWLELGASPFPLVLLVLFTLEALLSLPRSIPQNSEPSLPPQQTKRWSQQGIKDSKD